MSGSGSLKSDSNIVQSRVVYGVAAILVMVLILVSRLIYIQVFEHQRYSTFARENQISVVPLPPVRGNIYDRNGVILAQNQPNYTLEILPEKVTDMDALLRELDALVTLRPEDLRRFRELIKNRPSFEWQTIRSNLSEQQASRFALSQYRYPGVELRARLQRQYPYGELTNHVVGYVGRIAARDLEKVHRPNYFGLDYIGRSGLEAQYESILRGTPGLEQVETNAHGQAIRSLGATTPPTSGSSIYLSLDIELQRKSVEALEEFEGAVVALDPNTGEVLAFTSAPGYNPNPFVRGISHDAYAVLRTSPRKPLLNRALFGRYAPGSTIKGFLLAAAMEDGHDVDRHLTCRGSYKLPHSNHRYRDWKPQGHGQIDGYDALVQSCDVYFYDLARQVDIAGINRALGLFGFGKKTGIDVPDEVSGLIGSPEWKQRVRGQRWYPGETIITGIGQGYTLVTPLQLAVAVSVLANRGRRVTPQFLRQIENPLTGEQKSALAETAQTELNFSDEAYNYVIDGMHDVVHSPLGTARGIARNIKYRMAGKTGTAQVKSIGQDETYDEKTVEKRFADHSLFIGFAPVDEPKIAIAVVAEHAGSGSGTAAPIARKLLDFYLEQRIPAYSSTTQAPRNRPSTESQ